MNAQKDANTKLALSSLQIFLFAIAEIGFADENFHFFSRKLVNVLLHPLVNLVSNFVDNNVFCPSRKQSEEESELDHAVYFKVGPWTRVGLIMRQYWLKRDKSSRYMIKPQ